MSKSNENFMAFCNEFRTYVEVHHHFPNKHTSMLNAIKYTRRKIKEGTLEDWKREMFEEIAEMRDLTIHTGGRKKIDTTSSELLLDL